MSILGLKKTIFEAFDSIELLHIPETINAHVNIDGLPLFKSKRTELWPILCYLPIFLKCGVRVIGLYLGEGKPREANEFLQRFIDEAKILESNGMVYNDQIVLVKLQALVCDAVASAFITGTKSHCAYYGCPKSETEGVYVKNPNSTRRGRVTFQDILHERK